MEHGRKLDGQTGTKVRRNSAAGHASDAGGNFNAETVERLIRAGFQILGRTNSPELGLNASTEPRFHGPTRNPWSLHRTDQLEGGTES